MSTDERDESLSRPTKGTPGVRRENTEMDGERRSFNQGYNRSEGYEHRSYNRDYNNNGGGYPITIIMVAVTVLMATITIAPLIQIAKAALAIMITTVIVMVASRDVRIMETTAGEIMETTVEVMTTVRTMVMRVAKGANIIARIVQTRTITMSHNRPYRSNSNNYYEPQRPVRQNPNMGQENEGAPTEGAVRKRRPRVGDTRVNYSNYGNDQRQPMGGRQGGGNRYGNQGASRQGGYNNNNNNNRRGGNNNNNNNRRSANYNPNAKYSHQKQLKYKEVLADPNEPIRLNKFLSNAGVCSRREADEFIQAGAVKVNGEVVTELGTKITRQDLVTYNDKPVQIESKVYIVLNKPKNCVTTSDDPQERLTVMDLVKNACKERIYPVGRLDRNTTGVLLLTNDGDLASKLTHPSFKKKKIYHVWLDKNVSVEDMEKIANGLDLEDGEIHADAISYASETDKSQVGIEIHSGRNRIVRRIFESLGYHVVKLDRVYFAGLTKKNLGRGKWRYLNEKEVNALRMGAFE